MRSVFLCDSKRSVGHVYKEESMEKIRGFTRVDEKVYTSAYVRTHRSEFGDVKAIFSCWGMPGMTAEEIREIFPSLRAVFYGGGDAGYFAEAFTGCGIRVFDAGDEADPEKYGEQIGLIFEQYITENREL